MRAFASILLIGCSHFSGAQCTNYAIVVSGSGSSPAQISWQLWNSANVMVASGGAPANQAVCLPDGCYTMHMFDSGNNGWGQAPFWINVQPTNTVVAYGTLHNGSSGSQAITLGTGCAAVACDEYTLSVSTGSSPSQISWNFVEGLQVLEAGSAPFTTVLCLDTGCYSMQMFDSGGDGWNGATWTLSDPQGVPVQSGTLSSGAQGHAAIPLGISQDDCSGVGPMFSGDCPAAVELCGDHTWLIRPSGNGAMVEAPVNTIGNPFMDYADGLLSTWGTDNDGCLQGGEIHTTWMIVNILTSGTLEFTFGGNGTQAGYYDWIMYPHNGNGCAAIQAGTLAPVRCNWNMLAWGGTGLSSNPPPGTFVNYEPPLTVLAGEKFLIGFSNHTAITAMVPLVFGGTAEVGCPEPLPVELLQLSAEPVMGDVRVKWTTATEYNSLLFEVERSTDISTWQKIGQVPAAGNSLQATDYEFFDRDPVIGMNYYRLQIIDTDGSTSTSQVVAVKFDHDLFLVHPNPSEGMFWVYNTDEPIRVIDAVGRIVAFQVISSNEIAQQLCIRSPGAYIIQQGTGPAARHERVLIK